MNQPVTLHIFGSHSGTLSPYTYGVASGIYRRHGLDVTCRFHGATDYNVHELVADGDGDFAVGDTSTFLDMLDESRPLVAVMGALQGDSTGVMVHAGLNITKPEQLKGRTVTTSRISSERLFRAFLRCKGIDESEVDIVPLRSKERNALFLSGEASALTGNAINDSIHFETEGAPNVVIPYSLPETYIKVIITTRRDLAEKDPDRVKQFVQATAESYVEAYADPAGAAQSMIAAFPGASHPQPLLERQLLGIATYCCSKRGVGQPFGWMHPADWEETLDFCKKYMETKGDYAPADVFTNEFAQDNPTAPAWAHEWKTSPNWVTE